MEISIHISQDTLECMFAYGTSGEHDDIDSKVYDKHEIFEVTMAELKILAPININGQRILTSKLY